MVCTICSRFLGARPDGIPFFCVSCARSTLYETRLEHAKTLLDRARLGGQVEAIVEPSEATAGQSIALSSGTLIDVNESAKQVELERVQEDTVLARDSSRLVSEQITLLRCQIRQRRGSIGDRHEALGKRRAELAASRQRLADRSAKSLEQLKTVIKGGEMTWGKIHQQTVVGRADLCREAADIAGLRSRVRKVKDGSTRLEYVIGGMAIPDLVDMSCEYACILLGMAGGTEC